MLIRNVHIENALESCDVRIEEGVFTHMAPSLELKENERSEEAHV